MLRKDRIRKSRYRKRLEETNMANEDNKKRKRLVQFRKRESQNSNLEVSNNVLNSYDDNVIELIKEEFKNNSQQILLFDDIEPLMGQLDFIDIIVKQKIPFTSVANKSIADSYSKTLMYLSDIRGLGKGGNKNFGKETTERADMFAKTIGPIIDKLHDEGYKTIVSKTEKLNEDGIKSMRGNDWSVTTVKRIVKRWNNLKEVQKKNSSSLLPNPS